MNALFVFGKGEKIDKINIQQRWWNKKRAFGEKEKIL
jgi:hypothetical protein